LSAPVASSFLAIKLHEITLDKSNIFLVGCRGAGKTAVGKILAGLLQWEFVDTDALLESQLGRSIREIFEEEGEASFRIHESRLLQELCVKNRQVVATGGGVALDTDNRERLRNAGTAVWLTAEPELLWERIKADSSSRTRRPDLAAGGIDEVRQVLRARASLYESCAHHAMPTTGKSPQQIAQDILAILSPHQAPHRGQADD
jgi:shikimate kinase